MCALWLSVLTAACAQLPTTDFERVAARAAIDAVPFFPQTDQQCGAAALATMLAYRGVPVTASDLEPKLFIPGKKGTLALEMTAQARYAGMLSYPLQPELLSILREVEGGNPVLVFQNLGLNWLPQYHFAVVVGFDRDKAELILRSGTTRERIEDFKTFYNTWARAGFWARVVLPPDHLPVTAMPLPFLQAVSELEQLGRMDRAKSGYRAVLSRWRDDRETGVLARLGLANIAYRQGRYAEAQSWLLQNLDVEPRSAISWNNLGYALLAQQCPRAARQAIACAVTLAPENQTYRLSQDELGGDTSQGPAERGCHNPPPCPADSPIKSPTAP